MIDSDKGSKYFKKLYANSWSISQKKEALVAKFITSKTGLKVKFSGFGAGEETYYDGESSEYGFQKGDPDLHIEGTNIYIEVTGPLENQPYHRVYEDLWFRPDKINNALGHPERETWLCHVFLYKDREGREKRISRLIQINQSFIDEYNKKEKGRFKLRKIKTKRAKTETFIAIPSDYEGIMYIRQFCEQLNQRIKEGEQ